MASEIQHFEDEKLREHVERLHMALFNLYDLGDVVRYIEEKTYLRGAKFSFKNHEFQKDILSDQSRDLYVQKCAQVGLSEAMARYGLAISRIMPYFSTIMTMPSATDAAKFFRTRIDPIIDDSPDLRKSMDPSLNNTEIKGIGTSLLYGRGTRGSTTALSVPADLLIHDEVDRSDPGVLAQYQSRIKHSSWKLTRQFGTPTMDGLGISLMMESALRHRHMVKCNCCNHYFVPNYHDHVHIPGYDRDKKEITAHNLLLIDWEQAVVLCPKCGREPSLQVEHRSWVCENPTDKLEAHGYYVIPFSAPNVVSTPDLVKESTKYKTWTEFCNQALGETNNDDNAQLTMADIKACMFPGSLDSTELHHMGVDMGLICHFVVGRLTLAGELLVVHRERVALRDVTEAYLRLRRRFRVVMSIFDSQPYTDTVLRLQQNDENLYGGVYHTNRQLTTYSLKMVDENQKVGKLPINVANIHRNLNFDEVMHLFKSGSVRWAAAGTTDDALFEAHCFDMKRVQVFDQWQEMSYDWQKTEAGQDHYMHALGYLHVACRLAPAASRRAVFAHAPVIMRQPSALALPKSSIKDPFAGFRRF